MTPEVKSRRLLPVGETPLPPWRRLLWALIWPRQEQRISPTVSGVVLIALAMGIGTAAYNSASNILFIALSLLLACLILSGVLSWLNIRGVDWFLDLSPAFRVGHETAIGITLKNRKAFLPTYGLWFEFLAESKEKDSKLGPESTITGKGIDVRASLAKAAERTSRGSVTLKERLDPMGEGRVEWRLTPARRGPLKLELESVGSLFPFGFLRKRLSSGLSREVVVWPAPIEYRRFAVAGLWRQTGDERVTRAGAGSDVLALRRYEIGDSHRLIHWKASARTRRLLVRQFSAEGVDGLNLWIGVSSAVWTHPEQFETMVSLAATLAEDLFRLSRLRAVAIDADDLRPVLRLTDLETFLDALSAVQPTALAREYSPFAGNTAVFAPDGPRGVVALVNGNKAAAA